MSNVSPLPAAGGAYRPPVSRQRREGRKGLSAWPRACLSIGLVYRAGTGLAPGVRADGGCQSGGMNR